MQIKRGFFQDIASFPASFWTLNILQMLEKLAYWSVLLQLPVYIAQKDVPGGLHWDQTVKGIIFFWWALVQNIAPVFAGGYADRYGRKKTLFVSFALIICGYLIIGLQKTYWPFLAGTIILGLGSGIFKPALQGAVAGSLEGKNTSLGWGVYFMLLNLAVFFGPPLSKYLKQISWEMVFIGSAAIFALNILVLLFYRPKEIVNISSYTKASSDSPLIKGGRGLFFSVFFDLPRRFLFSVWYYIILKLKLDKSNNSAFTNKQINEYTIQPFYRSTIQQMVLPKQELYYNPFEVLRKIIRSFLDPRLAWFVVLMSGFTIIYMQFYETLPNFIYDWADTSGLVRTLHLPAFMTMQTERGLMISYEWLYNLNAGLIILGVVPLSWLLSGARSLNVIIAGIFLAALGLMISGGSMAGAMTVAGILIYTIGEMSVNPRFAEHLGLLAPEADKSLYLGYLNISLAIGLGGGSLTGGWMYHHYGEKAFLAAKYISEHYGIQVSDLSQSMLKLQTASGLNASDAAALIWSTYHPYVLWLPFVMAGIMSATGLIFYKHMVIEEKKCRQKVRETGVVCNPSSPEEN